MNCAWHDQQSHCDHILLKTEAGQPKQAYRPIPGKPAVVSNTASSTRQGWSTCQQRQQMQHLHLFWTTPLYFVAVQTFYYSFPCFSIRPLHSKCRLGDHLLNPLAAADVSVQCGLCRLGKMPGLDAILVFLSAAWPMVPRLAIRNKSQTILEFNQSAGFVPDPPFYDNLQRLFSRFISSKPCLITTLVAPF